MNIKFNNCDKFFGTSGYTSTSANYIANKAKEIAEGFATSGINFVTTTVDSIVGGTERVIDKGLNEEQFNKLIENKLMIAKLNGLISWMREAIKAKETMLNDVERIHFNTWMKENYPDVDIKTFGAELEENDYPDDNRLTDNEWAMQNMSVKEINEYLYLLAACSTIGKFIHPNGEYANARATAIKKDGTSKINDYQSSTIIYQYSSSIPADVIEKKFFELQELHREYQKRLNAIKFNIENEVQKLNDNYQMLVDKYEQTEARNQNKIDEARKNYNAEFNKWRIGRLDEIRHLKIIIPNDLKEVVEFVNNVQK
jgi:hypothetical protein